MRSQLLPIIFLLALGGSAFAQEKSTEELRKERAAAMERFEKAAAEIERLRKLEAQQSATAGSTAGDAAETITMGKMDTASKSAFEIFTNPNFEKALAEEVAAQEKKEGAVQPASSPSNLFSNRFEKPSTNAGSEAIASVTIGAQVWTSENLSTDRFRNGDPIPEAKTTEEWLAAHGAGQPAWCYYRNDPAAGEAFGRLYNWFAVADPRGLAPPGWHIPTDAEWETLSRYMGQSMEGGAKLRSTTGWKASSVEANNESGFNARPGSCRGIEGAFYTEEPGIHGFWWSSTPFATLSTGYGFELGWYAGLSKNIYLKQGLSVRCVRD